MKLLNAAILLSSLSCLSLNAKTLEQMQILHKEIGNELISIRKEFGAAQPRIYALLDRIDRMYNLAKNSVEKKKKFIDELQNKLSENKKIINEFNQLKNKLHETEKELDLSAKKLASINKELEIEKVQTAILSREKHELAQEKHELQSHVSSIESEQEKNKLQKKDLIPENILKSLTDDEKALLKTSQNLSLSSTSAPNSPR